MMICSVAPSDTADDSVILLDEHLPSIPFSKALLVHGRVRETKKPILGISNKVACGDNLIILSYDLIAQRTFSLAYYDQRQSLYLNMLVNRLAFTRCPRRNLLRKLLPKAIEPAILRTDHDSPRSNCR